VERESDSERRYVIGQATFSARPLTPALYLVATPIGNLGDVTLRALETLASADIVACEDTRVTRVLLSRYGMRRKLTAYHEHNEAEAAPRLIAAIGEGRSVALVSDAGTPLVSDPGYRLVRQANEADVRVVPVPGPSAVLAALSASGLPTDAFFFAGFLPSKAGQRKSRLDELRAVPGTLVFFESSRRLAASLGAMAEQLGNRPAAVGRELTKLYEEMRTGRLADLAEAFGEREGLKGEVVVVVGPPDATAPQAADVDALLLSLSRDLPASKAAAEAARLTGGSRPELYRRLLALKAGS
jgi:16S rRNA (cytidine1402-2'-O)-methyltransferase